MFDTLVTTKGIRDGLWMQYEFLKSNYLKLLWCYYRVIHRNRPKGYLDVAFELSSGEGEVLEIGSKAEMFGMFGDLIIEPLDFIVPEHLIDNHASGIGEFESLLRKVASQILAGGIPKEESEVIRGLFFSLVVNSSSSIRICTFESTTPRGVLVRIRARAKK